MKKIILLFLGSIILSGCLQTASIGPILGPAVTIATTGSAYQAGLSIATSETIENTTGLSPTEHVSGYVESKAEEKKKKNNFTNFVENHIKKTKEKLIKKN